MERRVGKIARHRDHRGAAPRDFAHARTARPDRVGNAPLRRTELFSASTLARCRPYPTRFIQ
jgi:hypothetical protein